MADTNICKDTELDFFLVESCILGGRDALLGMGMDAYVLFHSNGTVDMLMMGMFLTGGKWNDGIMTFTNPEDETESMEMKYSVDGDTLTLISDSDGGGDTIFARSDYASYDANATAPAEGGAVVEVTFTDLAQRDGRMSVVCPEGWYAHKLQGFGIIKFSTTPNLDDEDTPNIKVWGGAKILDRHNFLYEGEPVSITVDGVVWEGIYNKDEEIIEVYTIVKDDIDVSVTSIGLGQDSDVLREVMSCVECGWQ